MVWLDYTLAIIHSAVVLSVCLKMKKVVSTIVHADNQIPVSSNSNSLYECIVPVSTRTPHGPM